MDDERTTYEELSASELAELLDSGGELFVLDVREPEEVATWVIDGAVNIPLGDLADRSAEVPRHLKVVTVCAAGARSAVAASMLAAAGFHVANLSGGMAAWADVYDTAG